MPVRASVPVRAYVPMCACALAQAWPFVRVPVAGAGAGERGEFWMSDRYVDFVFKPVLPVIARMLIKVHKSAPIGTFNKKRHCQKMLLNVAFFDKSMVAHDPAAHEIFQKVHEHYTQLLPTLAD